MVLTLLLFTVGVQQNKLKTCRSEVDGVLLKLASAINKDSPFMVFLINILMVIFHTQVQQSEI